MQATDRSRPEPSFPAESGTIPLLSHPLTVMIVLLAGFSARIYEAYVYFLDPDEALHTLLANYESFGLTYKATLTTAHPPLLILFLHYWRWVGESEIILRLPSVVAGTLSCWLVYLWLRKVIDESAALVGLLLFCFAPALIELSAQVRQYAILNLFITACLYFSERAVQEDSPLLMNLFSLSLCGSVLTHYSSFLFVFSIGIYLLARLRPWSMRKKLLGTWAAGQVGVASLCAFSLLVHIPRLKQAGMPQGIAETWLRRSIYHPGESSPLIFPMRQTLRVFTYLFSHGLLGTLALIMFLAGVALLLRRKTPGQRRPTPRELALLMITPFLVNCALAFAGKYPYGGTRHDVYLAVFAIAGISIGFSLWSQKRIVWKVGLIITCLTVCNVFPAPPPLIRGKDHRKVLMHEAIASLESQAPAGSTIFAGYQSGLMLGSYLCRRNIVQVFFPLDRFSKERCGPYTVVASWPQQWQFEAGELAPALHDAAQRYPLPTGAELWLFEAGWMPAEPAKVAAELSSLGCKPQHFGSNIRFCPIIVENEPGK